MHNINAKDRRGRCQHPVFIMNVPRSGSTLMQVVLSSHLDISICPELTSLETILCRWEPCRSLSDEEKKNISDILAKDWKLQAWPIPCVKALDGSSNEPTRPIDVVNSIFEKYRDHTSPKANIIGVKKGSLLYCWKRVLRYWPQARVVFTYRDPHASVTSSVDKIPKRGVVSECRKWNRRIRCAYEISNQYPEQIKWIKYEDWVQNPADTIADVCSFIGVDYERDMERFFENNESYQMIVSGMEAIHENTKKPMRSDRVSAWKQESSRIRSLVISILSRRWRKGLF